MNELTAIPVANPIAELPPVAAAEKVPLSVQLATISGILIPLASVIAIPFLVWGWGFGWTDMGVLLGMYVATVLGITVGFHRLFVHHSFETYGWIKFIFAVVGSMAVQGSLFKWVGQHRLHHQHSDTPEDPHSPHYGSQGVLGVWRGFWHAHLGWFFDPDPNLDRYLKDLNASRMLRIISYLFPLWVFLGLAIPAVLGGVITLSWAGAWTGLLWGGLVRVFLVHHVTWSVNSACHLWGFQPYKSDDQSRNNPLLGILALGEGWHNTHHAFPTSARHGLRWWQIDVSYWVIRVMEVHGFAWNVKLPSEQAQMQKEQKA